MLDSYYIQPRDTQYVTKEVNVKEYKAPTDESVKLLNEMTEKALSNLVKTFSTTNNTLQMTCAVYDNYLMHDRRFLCKFTLNGKDHSLDIPIPLHVFTNMDSAIRELYTAVCSKLAYEIMQPLLEEMMKNGI